MANTSNVLTAFAIVLFASLSLSSAFGNLDIHNDFEKHLDHELQPFLREKRQKEAEVRHLRNNIPLELEEELLEPKPVYERTAVYEETEIGERKKQEEQKKLNVDPKISNAIEEEEENIQSIFSYTNVQDLIQALIRADEENIAKKLQQLRENDTLSETSSNLPKRQAVASASASAAAASSGLLGADLWGAVPLVDLDAHSCEAEAFSHGHFHVSGTIVHEFFCELRKLWHYVLIVLRNFKSELTLGPLIAGELVSEGIFGHLFHIFQAVIREPHHLLILPDIIQDAVPFPSIIGAFHRVKQVFFKVLHFGLDLIRGHARHVLVHLFSHPHLGVHLREKLHHLPRFGSILPLEEIAAQPIISAATATATATASSVIPDYHQSLAEVLSSFRGFYDGYHASGVPHLIRTGRKSFSMSSGFSKISSYLSGTPFFNYFGCRPVPQGTSVTSSVSSASSSVGIGGPVISPVVRPVASPIVSPVVSPVLSPVVSPVIEPTIVSAPVETVSSSASATATATVDETPVLSAGPTIFPSVVPYESTSSNAAAAATATATATAASPIVSNYPPVIEPVIEPVIVPVVQPISTLPPQIVSTVSESSSVAVAAPEIAVPILEGTAAASSVASASNIVATPVVGRVPLFRGHKLRHRPIMSNVAPAAAAAAAAASASATAARYRGLDLDIDRRLKHPLIFKHSRAFPATSSASAAAASTSVSDGASLSSAAASSSASSVSSGGYNVVLPREQVVGALGYDYLLPGDIITVTLRNKSILFGRVIDTTSPITFSFLRPKLRTSLLRHGGRFWNLLPKDFRDPEYIQKFNNPLLLRYGL